MESDYRDECISRVVGGKTFADVGGLWGTVNEKVSVARRLGASELTMLDITPEGGELWKLFRERMATLGIRDCRCIAADVCAAPDGLGFDVTHCSGVLYHHPNPMSLLQALRRVTREHLILTSAITQGVVENERGRYEIPPSGILLVPALNDREREILAVYWKAQGAEVYGITKKVPYRYDDFGPWWFLPTAEAMTAMCEASGFTVVEGGHTWNRNAYTLLLRV